MGELSKFLSPGPPDCGERPKSASLLTGELKPASQGIPSKFSSLAAKFGVEIPLKSSFETGFVGDWYFKGDCASFCCFFLSIIFELDFSMVFPRTAFKDACTKLLSVKNPCGAEEDINPMVLSVIIGGFFNCIKFCEFCSSFLRNWLFAWISSVFLKPHWGE